MKQRISAYIVLVGGLFFVPWWIWLPLVVGYGVYFIPAYEIIFLGFVADVVYGVPYIYTITTGAFLLCVYIVRSHVRV